ncbi:MAG: DNA protecting protein DprA [Clostridiales bacterium 43-6]|nr:MAG: DNA protecting protein DprA [Clostridiales bacterium 43-6]
MAGTEYWIWLQSALGYASPKPIRVLEHFENAEEFYHAGLDRWKNTQLFTPKELKSLRDTSLKDSDKIIRLCQRKYYRILTPEDENYPKRLLRITTPPAVLYVKGSMDGIDDEVVVTMVGTRKSTDRGNKTAAILAYRLAQGGAIVLSGGAKGIDTHCHLGALEAGGRTIVVLGCGLDYPYLAENHGMRCRAAEEGAVITEYQPSQGASKFSFPQRNRIMAALSLATVIVEAGERSGALITADQALEYGKDIFVIPGSIMDREYTGNNKLLRDGAKPIYSAMDILSEYICEYPHRMSLEHSAVPIGEDNVIDEFPKNDIIEKIERKKTKKEKEPSEKTSTKKEIKEDNTGGLFVKPTTPDFLSESAVKIYESFTNYEMPFDILSSNSKIPASEALRAITELELFGLIHAIPGNRYALTNRKER